MRRMRRMMRMMSFFWLGWVGALLALKLLTARAGLNRVDNADDELRAVLVFDGAEVASSSTAFRGGGLVCIYGGAQIDLSAATLADEATLRVGCLFGGVQIIVPEGVRVTSKQTALAGGVVKVGDDELPDDAPHLQIDALTVFGGVSISRPQEG